MTTALARAIRERRGSGRRALGIFLIPGYPDWRTSIAAVRFASEAGVTFVEFPVISEPSWSDRTGSLIATALDETLRRPDNGSRRAWLGEVEIGVAVVYKSAWPEAGKWRIPSEGAAALLLEHDVDDIAAYAAVARGRGTCLIPTVNAMRPQLTDWEKTALAVGDGFVYTAMGRRTGCLDAGRSQVCATIVAVRAERPDLPVCCAFGLTRPEDISQIAAECDGVIVGTAALERLSQGLGPYRAWLEQMLAAT